MLKLSDSLMDQPVLSLQTGTPIATAVMPVINPNNLKIEGFFCESHVTKGRLILLAGDIRDNIEQGFVVNSHDVLTPPEDLIRLKPLLDLHFDLIGKPVYTVAKQKLGKIDDYATEMSTLYVQKLYVGQSMLRSFTGGSLSVDRTQINEITNRRIIINDPLHGTPAGATATA